jgi:hypothetical protein
MKYLERIEEMKNPYETSKWQRGKRGCRKEKNTVIQEFKNPGRYVSLATIFCSAHLIFLT